MTPIDKAMFWARARAIARAWRGWNRSQRVTATPRGLGSAATGVAISPLCRDHAWQVVEVGVRVCAEKGADPKALRRQLGRVADGLPPLDLAEEVEDIMAVAVAIGVKEWGLV